MIQLTLNEARVLGVLLEKAYTVPSSYPMTINGILTGCNQKSNRDPVITLTEDQILPILDSLRGKSLVIEAHLTGSRVLKFKHDAKSTLSLETAQLALMTELLLRGPQTVGEIRTRASRMFTLESLEVVDNVLSSLMDRDKPYIEKLPPAPGSRAPRYAQLLSPEVNKRASTASVGSAAPAQDAAPVASSSADATRIEELEARVAELEKQVAQLIAVIEG